MSEQTYCFVLSPPWLLLTYHLQHNARCQTQTVMPIHPTAKHLCHLQPKSASGSFFCEVWSKRKKSENLWWNIFAWLRMWSAKVASVCISGWQIQTGRVADLLPRALPTLFMVDRAWPVCGPRHDRVKTWKVCIWRKRKKASDAALHVLKKYARASRGTKESYTQAHAHSLSQSRQLWKLSAQRWEYKAVLKHAAGIKRLFH